MAPLSDEKKKQFAREMSRIAHSEFERLAGGLDALEGLKRFGAPSSFILDGLHISFSANAMGAMEHLHLSVKPMGNWAAEPDEELLTYLLELFDVPEASRDAKRHFIWFPKVGTLQTILAGLPKPPPKSKRKGTIDEFDIPHLLTERGRESRHAHFRTFGSNIYALYDEAVKLSRVEGSDEMSPHLIRGWAVTLACPVDVVGGSRSRNWKLTLSSDGFDGLDYGFSTYLCAFFEGRLGLPGDEARSEQEGAGMEYGECAPHETRLEVKWEGPIGLPGRKHFGEYAPPRAKRALKRAMKKKKSKKKPRGKE